MSCGSLQHASTVTALLCSTKGTAPGEPIKSVRCAGDSCSSCSPKSLPAPHHWWGNTVELAWMGRRWNREQVRREEGINKDSSHSESAKRSWCVREEAFMGIGCCSVTPGWLHALHFHCARSVSEKDCYIRLEMTQRWMSCPIWLKHWLFSLAK